MIILKRNYVVTAFKPKKQKTKQVSFYLDLFGQHNAIEEKTAGFHFFEPKQDAKTDSFMCSVTDINRTKETSIAPKASTHITI